MNPPLRSILTRCPCSSVNKILLFRKHGYVNEDVKVPRAGLVFLLYNIQEIDVCEMISLRTNNIYMNVLRLNCYITTFRPRRRPLSLTNSYEVTHTYYLMY